VLQRISLLYRDRGANPWLEQLPQAGLHFQHLGGTLGGLVQAMRAARPALVRTHGYKAGILGCLAAARYGIPSISIFQMGGAPHFPVSLYAPLDR
jgi:hypothetical protein